MINFKGTMLQIRKKVSYTPCADDFELSNHFRLHLQLNDLLRELSRNPYQSVPNIVVED